MMVVNGLVIVTFAIFMLLVLGLVIWLIWALVRKNREIAAHYDSMSETVPQGPFGLPIPTATPQQGESSATMPGATPATTQLPAQPPAPVSSGPAWGEPSSEGDAFSELGLASDQEFARLAAEEFSQPPAVPLGAQETLEPFSWTAAAAQVEEPLQPAQALPVNEAPPLTEAPSFGEQEWWREAVAEHAATEVAAQDSPAQNSPAQSLPVQDPAEESIFAKPLPQTPVSQAPASAAFQATGITGRVAPLPSEGEPVEGLPSGFLDAEDRTVVVSRSSTSWVLELPDGTEVMLHRDSVVGRHPQAPEGATAVVIPDSTRTLSKTHARFRLSGETWTVEDLGSTNGLLLIDSLGHETPVSTGVAHRATEHMMLGTLKVRLRQRSERSGSST